VFMSSQTKQLTVNEFNAENFEQRRQGEYSNSSHLADQPANLVKVIGHSQVSQCRSQNI